MQPTDAQSDATCDIVTLSQLALGALKPGHARYYGQLEASDAALQTLEAAFALDPPLIHPADWF